MSDIGETIESFIIDKVEEVIDEKVSENVDNSYVVQDLRNDVDDIRSQVENLDETAIAQVVVDTIVSKLIGDDSAVYKKSVVKNLQQEVASKQSQINELLDKVSNLENPTPKASNE